MRCQFRARQQTAALLLLLAFLTLGRTDAGVIPGRWEKVDALPPGAHVEVVLRIGDERIKGSFEKSDAQSLTLTDETGTQRRVAKPDVKRVLDPGVSDSKWNGLLIGGAVGVGAGALLGPAIWGGEGETFTNADAALIYGLAGAFTGAFIGLLLDEMRDHPIVLYTARAAETPQVPPSEVSPSAKLSVDRPLE